MIPLKTFSKLKIIEDNTLILRSDLTRRIMFGVIFTVLTIAMIISFDFSKDFTGNRLGATLFYLLLMFLSLVITAWEKLVIFDKKGEVILFRQKLFFYTLPFGQEEIKLEFLKIILLTTITLMKRDGLKIRQNSRLSNYMENRTTILKLYLETESRKVMIAEGSYKEEIEKTGQTIAGFLGKPYKKNEG